MSWRWNYGCLNIIYQIILHRPIVLSSKMCPGTKLPCGKAQSRFASFDAVSHRKPPIVTLISRTECTAV